MLTQVGNRCACGTAEAMPIDILLVEDNPGDVLLTQEAFKEGHYAPRLSIAQDGEEALQVLRRQVRFRDAPRPDLILLDFNLPKKTAASFLRRSSKTPLCVKFQPLDMGTLLRKIRSIDEFWLNVVRLPSRA